MSQLKNNQKKGFRHHKNKQPWPVVLLIGGALLLVLGVIFTLNKPAQPKATIEVSGSPSLKVDKEKVDLGDVKLGRTVDVKFTLTNVGDQTLRFTKAPYVEVVEGC